MRIQGQIAIDLQSSEERLVEGSTLFGPLVVRNHLGRKRIEMTRKQPVAFGVGG
jgi:hypothetical protein